MGFIEHWHQVARGWRQPETGKEGLDDLQPATRVGEVAEGIAQEERDWVVPGGGRAAPRMRSTHCECLTSKQEALLRDASDRLKRLPGRRAAPRESPELRGGRQVTANWVRWKMGLAAGAQPRRCVDEPNKTLGPPRDSLQNLCPSAPMGIVEQHMEEFRRCRDPGALLQCPEAADELVHWERKRWPTGVLAPPAVEN
ncbi:MAG: hypothetical protein HY904_02295 [Deltaproteobacteria bacterium]|nr:hypothetical protein [Deltaproteobacteria bacterium]